MQYRVMTIQLEVKVLPDFGPNAVAEAINAALNEPPADWGDWEVGMASVVAIRTEYAEG